MGVRASLLAVEGHDTQRVLERLGLVETGEHAFDTLPTLACAVTPSGWVVVMGPEDYATPERLRLISASGEAVGLVSSETVMVNEAHGYADGRKIWSVTHDPERGPCDLQVEGEPPAQLEAIRERLIRQQTEDEEGDVDYLFDAAIELVDSICDFRWDQDSPRGESVLKLVEPIQTGAAGERQARRRALHDALTKKVEGELYALARSMGFERATDRQEFLQHHTPITNFNTLVRKRGAMWDSMTFAWNLVGELPKVEIYFFTRPLSQWRAGRSGLAHLAAPKRSLMDSLLGRNRPAPETFDSIIEKVAAVMVEVDAYLKDGTPSPNIIPPVYGD